MDSEARTRCARAELSETLQEELADPSADYGADLHRKQSSANRGFAREDVASLQTKKWPGVDENNNNKKEKKKKKKTEPRDRHHRHWTHPPPEFYDNLSKVWLTSDALRELDRRNEIQATSSSSSTTPESPRVVCSTDIARFARQGGPDLRHLRGYPEPENMPSRRASEPSHALLSARSPLTKVTTAATGSVRSSAYNNNFDQHLLDYNVYPEGYKPSANCLIVPKNFGEIQRGLLVRRNSLSSSQFGPSDFEDFRKRNREVVFETDVMREVVPVICGDGAAAIPNQKDAMFTELEPITNDHVTKPKPDFFDGAQRRDIDRSICDPKDAGSLYSHIIPTKHFNVPVAPNFFLEAKRPSANPFVAERQTRHAGSYGARGMHSLQNYGNDEQVFDGNAYTFSSTYCGPGVLTIYAHHLAAPTTPGGLPEYHMTELMQFLMRFTRESFIEGATAFRNARDMAKTYRDKFIKAANDKVPQPRAQLSSNLLATKDGVHDDSTPHDDVSGGEHQNKNNEEPIAHQCPDTSTGYADHDDHDDDGNKFTTHGDQTDRQDDASHGAVATQPTISSTGITGITGITGSTGSKRRRDSLGSGSKASPQKIRATQGHVEARSD